jgi:tetratricopeptide (TPR) repeat protein
VKLFDEALKLQPGDAAATRAQREALQALDASRTPPPKTPVPASSTAPARPPAPNPQAEYNKQMQAAAALEKQQKYAEAVQAYQAALRWVPSDSRASAAARNATLLLHWTNGQKAHNARRFAEAVKEYEEALKMSPNNADVKNALQRARQSKP